jgi:GTP-binding protein HflX
VAVHTPDRDDLSFEDSLAELGRLARTLGLTVTGQLAQRRHSLHAGTYVGEGKVAEIRAAVAATDAGVVLTDHELSPSQARNLERAVGVDVLDRTGVILEIFHRHARSRAAKAQVEIVRLQYMAPRLREQGAGRDRQRGGIGGKGAGESGMELDRRKIRDRVAELTAELESLETEARTRRARRRDLNRVALVGYTNAGKSTLMRALTGSEVYVADKLFATLDTTVRALTPETRPKVIVSDTVGFIDNLPHGLVASFKSTLDEALEASLLLHVVDVSDRSWRRQLGVTHDVLAEIGAGDVPRLMVFNKIDRVTDLTSQAALIQQVLAEWPDAIVMSAHGADDVRDLHRRITRLFQRDMVEEEVLIPYDRQHLRAVIFEQTEVLGERHDEHGTTFRLRATPATLALLRAPR